MVAASRHGIHARADEAALTNVERRDVHLDLFDRLERDRRDAGAVPGWLALMPMEELKDDPSTVMLFIRPSWPMKPLPPEACGVKRVTSVERPVKVG